MLERDTMLDFDLEYPLEKILTNMLDKVEGHVVNCDCVNCNSLEVLAYMIKVEEDNANI
jgi:hypothetical protein